MGRWTFTGVLALAVALGVGCGTAAPASSNNGSTGTTNLPDAGTGGTNPVTTCTNGLVPCPDGVSCARDVQSCPVPSDCAPGETRCPATATFQAFCADLTHDPVNCGICGRVCSLEQACVNGTCQIR